MLSANNLLRPQDGSPVTVPTQDMVLGSYYLTYEKDAPVVEEMCFETPRKWPKSSTTASWKGTTAFGSATGREPLPALDRHHRIPVPGRRRSWHLPREIFPTYRSDVEARMAYDAGVLDLHIPILIYRKDPERGHEGLVRTTVGRLIFNDQVPQDLGFIDRNDPEHWLEPEIQSDLRQEAAG